MFSHKNQKIFCGGALPPPQTHPLGEGDTPSPRRWGLGRGSAPSPDIFLIFMAENDAISCILTVTFAASYAAYLARDLKFLAV